MKTFNGSNHSHFYTIKTIGGIREDNAYVVMRREHKTSDGWYFNPKAAMEAAHWFAALSRELGAKKRAKTVVKKPKKALRPVRPAPEAHTKPIPAQDFA